MRILISYDFLKELGGLERVMFKQANSLSNNNEVTMGFAFVDGKNKSYICKELGLSKKVKIIQFANGKNGLLLLGNFFFRPILPPAKNFDLIISHSSTVSRMAKNRKTINKTPYLIYLHHPPNFLYDTDIKWVNSIERFFAYFFGLVGRNILKKLDIEAVRKANLVLVNSEYTKKRIKKIYGIDPKVIYPSISDDFKRINKKTGKDILKRFGLPEKFGLLHGRMIRDKRPDLALRAIGSIPDIGLVISGTIEEEKNIRGLIKKLGMEKRTRIIGRVSNNELIALYSRASCFLMPAPKEDFGLTPVEAMACGCPVVAWNDGAGPNETILPGVSGFLAKPYDIADFSRLIEKCLKKRWNKKKISDSVKKFSDRTVSAAFEKLVKDLASKSELSRK